MTEFTIDSNAPTTKFVCPNEGAEMNYHAPTDQWQCPVCGETEREPVLVTKNTEPKGS